MKLVNWIIGSALFFASLVIYIFCDKFGVGYWESIEKWAQTGDFFGGILNPIFAFLSLILIVFTLRQNQKALEQNKYALNISNTELSLSRDEFKNSVTALNSQVEQSSYQRFETTFFNMLSLQVEILNSLSFNSKSLNSRKNFNEENTVGRDVFGSILRWIDDTEDESNSLRHYDDFQSAENQVVGHYFRNLYQILKFVNNSLITIEEKTKYIRILRAQLSSNELGLLLFNCLSSKVDDGQFRDLLIKYSFLEHVVLSTIAYDEGFHVSIIKVFISENDINKYIKRDEHGDIQETAFGKHSVIQNFVSSKNIM